MAKGFEEGISDSKKFFNEFKNLLACFNHHKLFQSEPIVEIEHTMKCMCRIVYFSSQHRFKKMLEFLPYLVKMSRHPPIQGDNKVCYIYTKSQLGVLQTTASYFTFFTISLYLLTQLYNYINSRKTHTRKVFSGLKGTLVVVEPFV